MPQSKVWIYQADRPLNDREISSIHNEVKQFLSNWHAHGSPLDADFEILHRLFLVLKVDEAQAAASGCSIDKSVDFFKAIGQKYNVELFDRHQFAYEYNGTVYHDQLNNLDNLVEQGYITDDTMVFNNLVQDLEDYRQRFRTPFSQSWHKRMVSKNVNA